MYEPQREIEIILKKPRFQWRPLLLVMASVGWMGFIQSALEETALTADSSMMMWGLLAMGFTLVGLSASLRPRKAFILIQDRGIRFAYGSDLRSLAWSEITSWRWSDPMTERLLEQTSHLPPQTELLLDHMPEAGDSSGWVLVITPENGVPLSIWATKCVDPAHAESTLRSALVCNCPHQVIRDPRQGVIHVHQPAAG